MEVSQQIDNEVFIPDNLLPTNGNYQQNGFENYILPSEPITNGCLEEVPAVSTQDILETFLEQPLQEVPTTPNSYLEYLHVIINCTKLLSQKDIAEDTQNSVKELLCQAKKLFLENACNLLVQTIRAVDELETSPPKFWFSIYSLHEGKIWIELMDSLIFFWSNDEFVHLEEKIIMTHATALVADIEKLRNIYCFDENETPVDIKIGCLAKEVKESLELSLVNAIVGMKRATKDFLVYEAPKLQCILELAGLRRSEKQLTWAEICNLFRHISYYHFEQVFSLHTNKFKDWVFYERLRTFYLNKKAFQTYKSRDFSKLKPMEATLYTFMDKVALYVEFCVKFEKCQQNTFVQDKDELTDFLKNHLHCLVMNRFKTFKTFYTHSKEVVVGVNCRRRLDYLGRNK